MLPLTTPPCTQQISYKQGHENERTEQGEYNYPATQTPGYQSQKKLDPLKDVSTSIFTLINHIRTQAEHYNYTHR